MIDRQLTKENIEFLQSFLKDEEITKLAEELEYPNLSVEALKIVKNSNGDKEKIEDLLWEVNYRHSKSFEDEVYNLPLQNEIALLVGKYSPENLGILKEELHQTFLHPKTLTDIVEKTFYEERMNSTGIELASPVEQLNVSPMVFTVDIRRTDDALITCGFATEELLDYKTAQNKIIDSIKSQVVIVDDKNPGLLNLTNRLLEGKDYETIEENELKYSKDNLQTK